MQYLFDENGRRYLDAFGGIATVCCGHCHPYVVDSIVNQIKRIQHSTVLYLNHAIADFAEALASKMPGNLKVRLSLSLSLSSLIKCSRLFYDFFFFYFRLFLFFCHLTCTLKITANFTDTCPTVKLCGPTDVCPQLMVYPCAYISLLN